MIDLDCPECGEDEALHFTVEYEPDTQEYVANLTEQDCDCELTDTQIESLGSDAAEKWTEPDDDD
jgi:hypothetical protein